MDRTARNGFFAFVGIALVAVGALLLADRLVAPIIRPLAGVIHALSAVAWPVALIGVGVILITASRHVNTGARLYRSRHDRVIGGVLGGFATRWGQPAVLVRVLFVVLAILTNGFAALVLYILAMAFIPEESTSEFGASIPPAPPIPSAPPVPEQRSAPSVP